MCVTTTADLRVLHVLDGYPYMYLIVFKGTSRKKPFIYYLFIFVSHVVKKAHYEL